MAEWLIKIRVAEDQPFPDMVAIECYQRLTAVARGLEIRGIHPDPFAGSARAASGGEYEIHVRADLGAEELAAELKLMTRDIKDLREVRIQKVATESPEADSARADTNASASPSANTDPSQDRAEKTSGAESRSTAPGDLSAGFIRISLEKVEQLVNLVGELVISKSQVDLFSKSIVDGRIVHEGALVDFESARNRLELVTHDLRDLSLSIRMVPIEHLLTRFPAMVRELARKQSKRIELITRGGDTELDKVIIEILYNPLVHLLRNAADHGIEPPAERLAAGKPEQGHILIQATQESDFIYVIIEDDGRGLDPDQIARAAMDRGLVQPDELSLLGRRQIYELVFHPGFSTAAAVSDISGRGVGMDIVKSELSRISGTVEIDSQPGVGSRITLKIPLTLSILDALLIEDGEHVCALPLSSIERIAEIKPSDITSSGEMRLCNRGDYSVPVLSLPRLFGEQEHLEAGELFLIETSLGTGKFGILTHRILRRQEIVIKSLGDYIGKVPGIVGGTILGDGTVALILDVQSCSELLRERVVNRSRHVG